MSIGSFGATQEGILVTITASNDGPESSTIVNDAPWMFIVLANTMDRQIVISVKFGNGAKYDGESLYESKLFKNDYNFWSSILLLVHLDRTPCNKGLLESMKVKGKIMVCVTEKNTTN
ncbi:hypothetical protein AHAS_Ahas11G0313100 [Arachis hypogaea]